MDPPHRRLAERRLVAALRRLHRRDPLRAEVRTDAVLRELRADPGERLPAGHRGGGSLRPLSDADLLAIVDALVASGRLLRRGHRVRLPEHEPIILDSEMRARVDRLLSGLRDAGAHSLRYSGQLGAYLFVLTDHYPHGSPLAGEPPSEPSPSPESDAGPSLDWGEPGAFV